MPSLAPIEVKTLLLFPLKSKRLKRIAGSAPKKTLEPKQLRASEPQKKQIVSYKTNCLCS